MSVSGSLRRCTSTPTARALTVALLTGVPAALVVAALPWVGGDLVAQRWWAGWATGHGGSPVDFGWYGGTPSASYSLLTPWLMALIGVTACGVLGTVGGAVATGLLLARAGARRPAAGAALAALTFAANQLSGRTTFGLGAALGVLALLLLTVPGGRWWRGPAVAVAAALSGALSPVASALIWLAAAAWLLSGGRARLRPRLVDAAWLAGGAAVPLVLMLVLGATQGISAMSDEQLISMALAVLVMLAVLGRRPAVVSIGLLLTLVALLAIWLVTDPVGSNVTRLVLLFGVPVLVAVAPRWPLRVAVAAGLVLWLMPPLVTNDLIDVSAPRETTHLSGLLTELADRAPIGRVEVIPLNTHLESEVVGAEFPLARGWLRQVDLARNPVLYDGTLDATTYRQWLLDRGVSYVARPEARVDWPDHREARLVREGLPYLTEVWSDEHWTLYAVEGGQVLQGAADLVSSDRDGMVIEVREPGVVEVALYWNEKLTLNGPDGCLRPARVDGTVLLDAQETGTYRLTSRWSPSGQCD